MQIFTETPEQYIEMVPEEKREAMIRLRETIQNHLPAGFEEMMSWGMITYVVPLSIYPEGYQGTSKQPLPLISIAAQKNYIALYHMGVYSFEELQKWFVAEYPKHVSSKLDMGKGCIRFKKPDQIPYELIGQLVSKITVQEWVDFYDQSRTKKITNKFETRLKTFMWIDLF